MGAWTRAVLRHDGHLPQTAQRVSALATSIKEDVTRLNTTLGQMEKVAAARKSAAAAREEGGGFLGSLTSASTPASSDVLNAQEAEHSVAVVGSLKHSLLEATAGLQTALTVHTSSLQQVAARREQLGVRASIVTPAPAARAPLVPPTIPIGAVAITMPAPSSSLVAPAGASSSSSRPWPGSHSTARSGAGAGAGDWDGATAPMLGPGRAGAGVADVESLFGTVDEQQLAVRPSEDAYYAQRAEGMVEVQRQVSEVSQLFQRLATLISDQGEVVDGIEQRVDDAATSLVKAEASLTRVEARAQSRWILGFQITAVLLAFLIAFLLFAA